jgi:hypothetical protein
MREMLGSMPILAADPVVVSAAPAQDATKAEASTEAKASWYGWQTLLADTGSALLFVFALKVNNGEGGAAADVLAGASLFGYALGGPLVHWQHDRDVMAYVDFSMRLGLPLLLGQLATTASSQSDIGGSCTTFCGDEGTNFAEGLLAGMATAVLVDAVALSWEFVAAPKSSATRTPRLRWTPIAGAARGGAMGGVGGTF